MTGLCTLGLALSIYLGWHDLVGGAVIGCGGGSSCDAVLNSRWSSIGGVVPVSGLAAGTYLAMLLASFFIGPRTALPDRRLAWGAMLILAGAAAGSAVWFIIIQKWIVGALCPYCMATHVIGLLLAGIVLWRAPMGMSQAATIDANSDRLRHARPYRRGVALGWALIGVALASVMATSQAAFAPPAAFRAGAIQVARPDFNPRVAPIVGPQDARYVVAVLFDYRCSHCQRIHSMLESAIAQYGGSLAFALCPAPLNTECNPYVARQVDEFKDSCDLARLGLALWRADPKAHAEFDRWMFGRESGAMGEPWHPRSLEAATAKAIELIGQPKLDAARKDPWIDQFLQISVRTFGQTIGPNQSGNAVPKLVFGQRWVTPEPKDAADLLKVLQQSLGLPQP